MTTKADRIATRILNALATRGKSAQLLESAAATYSPASGEVTAAAPATSTINVVITNSREYRNGQVSPTYSLGALLAADKVPQVGDKLVVNSTTYTITDVAPIFVQERAVAYTVLLSR